MKAEDIFLAVLDKNTPAQRMEYLNDACGDNAELRAKVNDLLHSNDEAGSFLDGPLFDSAPTFDQPPRELPGAVIGPYKLLEQIAKEAWVWFTWPSSSGLCGGLWR